MARVNLPESGTSNRPWSGIKKLFHLVMFSSRGFFKVPLHEVRNQWSLT